MPQVMGVIELAAPRQTSGGRTIYDVTIAGQKYSTFDPGAYRVAAERIGQQVVAEVTVKPSQDGQFMNYFFEGIPGVEAAAPQAINQIPGQQAMVPQLPVQPGLPMAAAPNPQQQYQRAMDPAREAKIVKQSCMATAFNFVGQFWQGAGPEGLDEAERQALDLAKRLYVQVLGAPQTLDDEIVENLIQQAPEPQQPEHEDW